MSTHPDRPSYQHTGMTGNDIRAALLLRGFTLKMIADEAGVTIGAVTQTIHRYSCSRYKGYRIREYIAKALEKRVEEIWPDTRAAV